MNKKAFYTILLIFLLFPSFISAQEEPEPYSTYEELQQAIDSRQRMMILDVRGRAAYREGHIPGARNIPLGRIIYETPNVSKDAIIVVYGAFASESDRGAFILKAFGFRNVYDFGSVKNWLGELETR